MIKSMKDSYIDYEKIKTELDDIKCFFIEDRLERVKLVKKNIYTKTYDIGNDYNVEIEIDADNKTYDAWISHNDIGIKKHMFGIEIEQDGHKIEISDFFDMVTKFIPEEIKIYEQEYSMEYSI